MQRENADKVSDDQTGTDQNQRVSTDPRKLNTSLPGWLGKFKQGLASIGHKINPSTPPQNSFKCSKLTTCSQFDYSRRIYQPIRPSTPIPTAYARSSSLGRVKLLNPIYSASLGIINEEGYASDCHTVPERRRTPLNSKASFVDSLKSTKGSTSPASDDASWHAYFTSQEYCELSLLPDFGDHNVNRHSSTTIMSPRSEIEKALDTTLNWLQKMQEERQMRQMLQTELGSVKAHIAGQERSNINLQNKFSKLTLENAILKDEVCNLQQENRILQEKVRIAQREKLENQFIWEAQIHSERNTDANSLTWSKQEEFHYHDNCSASNHSGKCKNLPHLWRSVLECKTLEKRLVRVEQSMREDYEKTIQHLQNELEVRQDLDRQSTEQWYTWKHSCRCAVDETDLTQVETPDWRPKSASDSCATSEEISDEEDAPFDEKTETSYTGSGLLASNHVVMSRRFQRLRAPYWTRKH